MTPSESADVVAIQSVLATYIFAIDQKDFDALDDIFADDAKLEYILGEGQVISGGYPQVKDWIIRTINQFPVTQHLIGLPRIVVNGETANATSMLFNPMLLERGERRDLFFVGGTYHDRLRKTNGAWKIVERVERGSWQYGSPADWTPPPFPAA